MNKKQLRKQFLEECYEPIAREIEARCPYDAKVRLTTVRIDTSTKIAYILYDSHTICGIRYYDLYNMEDITKISDREHLGDEGVNSCRDLKNYRKPHYIKNENIVEFRF